MNEHYAETGDPTHVFVIGAQKSGTTWLQHVFDGDDRFDVHEQQELHFFTRPDMTEERAAREYPAAFRNWYGKRIGVEVTPTYLFRTKTAPMIARTCAALGRRPRVVAMLREPISRAFSEYQMIMNVDRSIGSFSDCLIERPRLLDKGRYAVQLEAWFDAMGRDNVLVLFFDDIRDRPGEVLATLSNFLGLKTPIESGYEKRTVNAGGVDRLPALSKARAAVGGTLRRAGLTRLVHAVKDLYPVRALDQINKRRMSLDPSEADALRRGFSAEIDRLDALVGLGARKQAWGYGKNEGTGWND